VSDGVEEQEARAIREAVAGEAGDRAPASVEPRNFRQPRRLSKERLQYLAKLVGATLQAVSAEISSPLRQHYKIHLASVSEINALDLFSGFEPPFLVDIFECGGHMSWILWDSAAASAAVEAILSGPETANSEPEEGDEASDVSAVHTARRLSRSECRVIEKLLSKILLPVAGAFGLEVSQGHLAQDPEELTTLEDCGPDSDARRLMLHFLFEGPGGPSDIRIYLPGVGEEDQLEGLDDAQQETPLPEHLDGVRLCLKAYLGSVDVPLDDLLALEVGDVIPIGVDSDAPLDIYIEDRCCAKAELGRHRGQRAIRLLELDSHPGEIDQPTPKP